MGIPEIPIAATKMLLNIVLLFFFFSHNCCGARDIPFYEEAQQCADDTLERMPPLFEFEKPSLDRMLDIAISLDVPFPFLRPFSGINDLDLQFRAPPTLRLKKRSITEPEKNLKEQYEVRFLTPLIRETRQKEEVKTIQLPPSFTPRLGRKRSPEINGNIDESSKNSEAQDWEEPPILGRSEKKNKINLFAGNAFTPRLGRSEDSSRIRFQAGSAFTPRLGRSVFTSRSDRINLNAGSAFTPRLGRSDESRMNFNAGSSFTPRLGRSEDQNKIQLNAGSAFTPRLG